MVLSGILEWGREIRVNEHGNLEPPRSVPFEKIFDLEALARTQPVVLLSDLQRQGWDRNVEEVILLKGQVSSMKQVSS